jgi:hypothetical protein
MPAQAPKAIVKSLRQMILEADPDFEKNRRDEPAYVFPNGRVFKQPHEPYRES